MYKKREEKKKLDLSSVVFGKAPPQNIECERKLIGVIMQSQDALSEVVPILTISDVFYKDEHQKIYSSILRLYQKGGTVDFITMTDDLQKHGELEMIGGTYQLITISNEVTSNAKVLDWAFIIKEQYIKRMLIAVSGDLMTEAYNDGTDSIALLDKAQERLQEVSDSNYAGTIKSLSASMSDCLDNIDENINSPYDFTGVPTGYGNLDRITGGGFQKKDLILVSAEPSVGKTAFILNIAWNTATNIHKATPVIIFSLEMGTRPVIKRLIANVGSISMAKLNEPKRLSVTERQIVFDTANVISQKPIIIDDKTSTNTLEMKAKIRKAIKMHGPDLLVVVDYIQLAKILNGEGMNNEEKISKVSQHLKEIAKDLDVPIIAISSLSRDGKLRGSGNLDFDADVIMHIRKPTEEDVKKNPSGHMDDRIFDITKHRNGETDFILLRFFKEYQRFVCVEDVFKPMAQTKIPLTPPPQIEWDNPMN